MAFCEKMDIAISNGQHNYWRNGQRATVREGSGAEQISKWPQSHCFMQASRSVHQFARGNSTHPSWGAWRDLHAGPTLETGTIFAPAHLSCDFFTSSSDCCCGLDAKVFRLRGSDGDAVMTQPPLSLPIIPGEPASMSCRSSHSPLHSNGYTYLNWDLQKPGQPPQLPVYLVSNWDPGVPDTFSGGSRGQISRLKSAGWRLRMLGFIITSKIHSLDLV
ncbi:uncharacterized protein LOC129026568 [Pongo pygmaeus]|uniref:uncharacterized protein LOC129026568 n=1 Tax=Pongo pygmaeus TaxID=9600 RepID=UPI0023E30089|nr:uncharacterized protein LOC129026568 [Pongo pygmaeus]